MSILLRSRMFYDCDLESERDLSWDSTFLIYTRENGGKWWKIGYDTFIEVFTSAITSSFNAHSGEVDFISETKKNILFPKAFTKKPDVVLQINDSLSKMPYKTNVSKTGFTVNFQIPITTIISWTATEI